MVSGGDPRRIDRLILRPPAESDIDRLTELLADPEVARWWPDYDRPRVALELAGCDGDVRVIEHVGAGAEVEYVQVGECDHGVPIKAPVQPTGEVVGAIQVYENLDPQYRHAGIDLFIGRPYWGRGFATEAIGAVIDELLFVRGHHRLVIDPALENQRAIAVYEALGFRRVGVMRQYERGPDGQLRDGLLLELIRDDYSPSS